MRHVNNLHLLKEWGGLNHPPIHSTIYKLTPYSTKPGLDDKRNYLKIENKIEGTYTLVNEYKLGTFPFDKQHLIIPYQSSGVMNRHNFYLDEYINTVGEDGKVFVFKPVRFSTQKDMYLTLVSSTYKWQNGWKAYCDAENYIETFAGGSGTTVFSYTSGVSYTTVPEFSDVTILYGNAGSYNWLQV